MPENDDLDMEDMLVMAYPVAMGYLTFANPVIDPVPDSSTPPPTYEQLAKSMVMCNEALAQYLATYEPQQEPLHLAFDAWGNVGCGPIPEPTTPQDAA